MESNGSCDDGNPCTRQDKCDAGICRGRRPAGDGGACDDGDTCTEGDKCSAGVCIGEVSAACGDDVTAPELRGLSYSPAEFETGDGAVSVVVSIRAQDDRSGVVEAAVTFRSPSNGQIHFCAIRRHAEHPLVLEGTCEVSFPQFSEAGRWRVEAVDLADAVGNSRRRETAELRAAGFDVELSVAGANDVDPPELVALAFTPDIIDPSSGGASVQVSLRAIDDIAGITGASVSFRSPSDAQIRFCHVALATPNAGLEFEGGCSVTLPQSSEAGVWRLQAVELQDAASNSVRIETAELSSASFPTALTVLGAQDVTSPTLESLSFVPNSIDTRTGDAAVQVTILAHDDHSSISEAAVWFTSPSQSQRHFCRVDRSSTGTNPLNASCDVIFPRFSESGVWLLSAVEIVDVPSNSTFMEADQLRAAGFDLELRVSSE
jgi:hypothetical protein